MKKRDRFSDHEQERQPDDLTQARKQKKRRRFWHKVFALLLAGAVVWGLLFLRKDIARLDLGMHLGDLLASYSSGSGYPVELPAGQALNTAAVGKDLALLTDTNLILYNSQGKATGSYEHGYTNPICQANGDRVLVYDRGGKRLQVNSRSKQLFTTTLGQTISSATLGASGHIAVVSDAKYFENCITVFDNEYDEIYIRETAEMVTGVCLETRGGGMAVAGINANGGRLDSTITFFSFAQEEPLASLVLEDQLVLSMQFVGHSSNSLQVITDQQALVLSPTGSVLDSYSFDGLFVSRFANNSAGGVFLLLDQMGDGNRLQLVALDGELKQLGSLPLREQVQDMRLGDGFLCLYTGGHIVCYSADLAQSEVTDLSGWYQMQPAGHNLYGITAETIELFAPEVASAVF